MKEVNFLETYEINKMSLKVPADKFKPGQRILDTALKCVESGIVPEIKLINSFDNPETARGQLMRTTDRHTLQGGKYLLNCHYMRIQEQGITKAIYGRMDFINQLLSCCKFNVTLWGRDSFSRTKPAIIKVGYFTEFESPGHYNKLLNVPFKPISEIHWQRRLMMIFDGNTIATEYIAPNLEHSEVNFEYHSPFDYYQQNQFF